MAKRAVSPPLFGLAPGGVCLAARVAASTGELLPRRFTLTPLRRDPPSTVPGRLPLTGNAWRFVFCGTFLGIAPTGCYPAPCPMELGLSSESRRPRDRHIDSPAFNPGLDSTSILEVRNQNPSASLAKDDLPVAPDFLHALRGKSIAAAAAGSDLDADDGKVPLAPPDPLVLGAERS
jgi:hypothetical protein